MSDEEERRDGDYVEFLMQSHQQHLQYHDEMLKRDRASEVEQVRVRVAEAMIPVCGQEGLMEMARHPGPHAGLRTTLDWWVAWITGELPDEQA